MPLAAMALLGTFAGSGAQTSLDAERSPPPPRRAAGSGMTVLDVVLDGVQTGTGFAEDFKLGLPTGWETRGPAPLLIAWHGYGGPPLQVFRDSDYADECERRGWFLLAPRGLDDQSFGWPPSQRNVHAALRWVLQRYPVDRRAILGVGWSMGAQCILSFAARYQDPQDVRLAAVAGIAGPYDVAETYERESQGVRSFLEQLFGGPPGPSTRTSYRAISLLEVQPGTARPAATPRMAWNLEHVPTLLVWAEDDPITYLPAQSEALLQVLQTQGTTVRERRVRGVTPAHDWRIVAASVVCDFLAGERLEEPLPVPSRILSDGERAHGSVYLHPDPNRLAAIELHVGATTPMSIDVDGTDSLARLELSGRAFGWSGSETWEITHATSDATLDEIVVRDRTPAPTRVLRDGAPWSGWRYVPSPAGARLDLGSSRGATFRLDREGYETTLTMPETARIGTRVRIRIEGTGVDALNVLFVASELVEFPFDVFSPNDPRWLEVSPLPPTLWLPGASDPLTGRRIDLGIPPHAALVGQALEFQSLLLQGGTTWGRTPRVELRLLP